MSEQHLTPTQRLHEITMAALNRAPREPECTVELTLNAKGDVQISVSGKGGNLAAIGLEVEAEFDRLCAKYPRAVPTDADTALKEARKAAAIQANIAKASK